LDISVLLTPWIYNSGAVFGRKYNDIFNQSYNCLILGAGTAYIKDILCAAPWQQASQEIYPAKSNNIIIILYFNGMHYILIIPKIDSDKGRTGLAYDFILHYA
jgi:hypothetical protein